MNDVQRFVLPSTAREPHPLVIMALASSLAHAFLFAVCGSVFAAAVVLLVDAPHVWILRGALLASALAFGAVMLERGAELASRNARQIRRFAALSEARLETFLDADLNLSGRIGDVPMLEAPTTIEVIERPIIANKKLPEERRWRRGNIYVEASEMREFVTRGKAVGIKRDLWLGTRDRARYRFNSGRECSRDIYELCVETLVQANLVEGRADGHDGRIVDAAKALEALRI
jgi:hypothetical protein